MRFTVTQVLPGEVDMEAERERIDRCDFSDDMRKRLHKACDLFEEGKFEECIEFTGGWGRCPDKECPELEYLNMAMYETLKSYHDGATIKILPDNTKVMEDLKMALDGLMGGGFIAGTLIVNGNQYTLGHIEDPEVEVAVARLYVKHKSERAAYYDMAVRLLKRVGETPEQWKVAEEKK